MISFRVSDVAPAVAAPDLVTQAERLAELGWTRPEAFRLAADRLVAGPLVHPLALAVDRAFTEHRPLVLTPDAVWLCLAQSLATHVELHAEALRPRLVRHQGQLPLEVRRDDFVHGDPANDWPGAVDALVAKVREHLGGRADLFVADFSTTGALERVASQIALLGAMRQYFAYTVGSLCGIPEITLAGTVEDWVSIRRRAAVFGEFDLDWWLVALDPALATFEDTARGTIDVERWKRFYKQEYQSGGERSYGWFNALFAYVGDPPERSEFPDVDADSFAGHKLADFPPGRTRAAFTWKFPDRELAMELVGGLWGVTVDDRGALGVAAGWVVAPRREPSGFALANNHTLSPRVAMTTLESLVHEATAAPRSLWIHGHDTLCSLAGVEHVPGLTELTVYSRQLVDIAPLAKLTKLRHVSFDGCPIESIEPLAGIASLERLDLTNCKRIRGLGAVLATLPQLRHLGLMNTELELADFLPIANMLELDYAVLWNCAALPEPLRRMHSGADAIASLRAAIRALGIT